MFLFIFITKCSFKITHLLWIRCVVWKECKKKKINIVWSIACHFHWVQKIFQIHQPCSVVKPKIIACITSCWRNYQPEIGVQCEWHVQGNIHVGACVRLLCASLAKRSVPSHPLQIHSDKLNFSKPSNNITLFVLTNWQSWTS